MVNITYTLDMDIIMGLILFWENFLLRAYYFIVYQVLFWNLGVSFGVSSSHLKNFERILGCKIGYVHGARSPKSRNGFCNANLASLILIGQAREPVLNSPTPLFIYKNLSIKKTRMTCVNSHKLVVQD